MLMSSVTHFTKPICTWSRPVVIVRSVTKHSEIMKSWNGWWLEDLDGIPAVYSRSVKQLIRLQKYHASQGRQLILLHQGQVAQQGKEAA